jgi:predicted site-specific integrase-resolvase
MAKTTRLTKVATTRHAEPSLVYTQAEAARLIHPKLAPRTLERWRRDGSGPRFVRVGKRVGYTRDALEEYIEKQSRRHTAEKR